MKKPTPNLCLALFSAVFLLTYVLVVGTRYHATLRMMDGNSWIDNPILHLYRWPYLGALLMAVFVLGVPVLFRFLYNLRPLKTKIPWWVVVPATFFMAWMCPPKPDYERYTLFSQQMNVGEQFYRYMFMADEGRWQDLLEQIRKDGTRETPIGMRYALLAESAQGALPQVLFSYPITSPDDLLMRGERNPISCQFNRQFYENLGVYDEAFHQAMEYGLLQREGCCLYTLRQLIDYAIREGDARIADKYLTILSQSALDQSFVKEQKARLKKLEQEQMEGTPSAERPLRADNFVGVYPLRSEMVRLAYYEVGDHRKALDYTLCSILLQKQLSQFYRTLSQFPDYAGQDLPMAYREAMEILQSDEKALRDSPPGTYAYFYYNVSIPEEREMELKSRD